MSIGLFWVHTATVKTFTGRNSYGPTYDDPTSVSCFVNDADELVRNADGEQVLSRTVLYADVADAALFTPESEVILSDSRTATVITRNVNDAGDLPLPQHVEVRLT